jgi:DNA polymerase I-like protein with 3'-5' exonuclease and polymerase domains
MPIAEQQVTFTRCILTPVLAQMEFIGVQLHKEKVRERYAEVEREYGDARGRACPIFTRD